jgi:gluconate 5-dehydrogenase
VLINTIDSTAAAALRDRGLKAGAASLYVTDHAASADAVEMIVARYGALNILMKNAGIIIRQPVETHDIAA